ncbi:MAG: hypothetical protein N2445_04075 [Acidobacteria bacterium]|nr:hypothetical protein [Acidobacteriota bacterium]
MRRMMPLLLFVLSLLTNALEPLTQEAARARLASLEGLLSANKAVIDARWQELKRLDRLISVLWQESSDLSEESSSDLKAEKVLDLEEKLSQLHSRRLSLLNQIHIAYEEQKAIKDQIDELKNAVSSKEQILDGKWMVVMMPSEQRGELYLAQNGTLVSGEYKFENGQNGNVQGVFVKGHLVLERIDSQYGRMGKFEAQLMKDQNSLKGTWYSYDIQSGEPLTGALVISRPPKEEAQ